MPVHPSFFDQAVTLLEPVLVDLPGKLVAVDGDAGTGKTSLGRYLAWYFNSTLIESDNFLLDGKGLLYETAVIDSIIRRRLCRPRPVFLEGIVVLKILQELERTADFHLHLWNEVPSSSQALRHHIDAYNEEFRPREVANALLHAKHE